ncbi:MAG: TerB family tellurite resistance protein [Hasllibacter sp.]
MSVWSRIDEFLRLLATGEGLSAMFARTPPERSVAFTIAVIALGAKMAKADGEVSRAEVIAFREVFHIPEDELANAGRVFDLARQDVAGFETYAERIGRMFPEGDPALIDLMDCLFHVALADGTYHPAEDAFLSEVAARLGLPQSDFVRLRAAHVPGAEPDPWEVLGVAPEDGIEAARAAWRAQVRETHPDRMMGRGLPEEAVRLAERRMQTVNRAWEAIREAA